MIQKPEVFTTKALQSLMHIVHISQYEGNDLPLPRSSAPQSASSGSSYKICEIIDPVFWEGICIEANLFFIHYREDILFTPSCLEWHKLVLFSYI